MVDLRYLSNCAIIELYFEMEASNMLDGYQYTHIVHYYETDQMKVVHHSNYIRWFEEARTALLKDAGIPYHIMEQNGIIIPVVDVSCKYKNMTRFGEEVVVTTKISKFNGVVIEFAYEVHGKESGQLKVIGTSSHCFLDEDYKVISLKKKYPDIYAKMLEYME